MICVHVSTEQGYCRWCHTTYSYGECKHRYANAIPGQWTNAALVSHHVPSLCLNTRWQLMVASATVITQKHIFHRRLNIRQLKSHSFEMIACVQFVACLLSTVT